jgi:RNA polymerase sigma factor (sigma-70 family)
VDVTVLLSSAARGDQVAWNALIDRYSSLLWSIARSHRLPDADAADAVQTTWLKLVENLGRITDPERLAGWLATTARRECLQVIRRTTRDRRAPGFEHMDELAGPSPPVDQAVLLDERDKALWRALATLSERCQRLLRVLMATPPPAYTEVAAALDMPIGSIGPTRRRCLGNLREVVQGDELLGIGRTEDQS